ncbi:NUDIX hydrolase [Microbispora sp. NPDC049125]|uniref:NUDIX hydrolase n=1 Tax=Microbispora sp. NPDC049125 TaxID=3154929 RepID=UPI0034653514
MRWKVNSEEPLYTDPWLDIRLADVELPDGRHLDHRLIRTPPGEETGWRPGSLRPLLYTQPTNGISDSAHHIFRADESTHIGVPTEPWESERIDWVPLTDIRRLIDKRDIVSGTTLAALLYVLTEA